jgi:dihydropteroate synthase
MGILNLTPDSFSDGGRFNKTDDVLACAVGMVESGVDIIDVGAESTRPNAAEVDEKIEWQRIKEVLPHLYELKVPISVDSRKPYVMNRALSSGVDMINDVSGFQLEETLKLVLDCAKDNVAFCIMHMQGNPQNMQDSPRYADVVAEVEHFLMQRHDALISLGVKKNSLLIDPGFGFGKTKDHNLSLLKAISRLKNIAPVLVGISRKRLIAEMSLRESTPNDRLGGSLAAAIWSVSQGASVVRVHDVKETVDGLRVFHRLVKNK